MNIGNGRHDLEIRLSRKIFAAIERALPAAATNVVSLPELVRCGTTDLLLVADQPAMPSPGVAHRETSAKISWRRTDFIPLSNGQLTRDYLRKGPGNAVDVHITITPWGPHVIGWRDGWPYDSARVEVLPSVSDWARDGDFCVAPGVALPRTSRILGRDGIAEWSQGLSIGIVGAGRLGLLVLEALAAQGARDFVGVDGDILTHGNLDGTPLVSRRDVGQYKIIAAARHLVHRFPDVRIECLTTPVQDVRAVERLARARILIGAVDDPASRYFINALAERFQQVYVDVGTGAISGGLDMGADVRLIVPGESCLACMGGVPEPLKRQPGTSSRHINAIASSVVAEMVLASVGHAAPNSSWRRITTAGAAGVIRDERLQVGHECNCKKEAKIMGSLNNSPSNHHEQNRRQ